MTTITRYREPTSLALSLIAALALAVPAQRARAASGSNPGVLPPNSYAYGKTYGGWSAAYWHWAISIPAHDNPFLDDTGAHCGAGQSGPVWFLAYVINPVGTLQRQCTVPAGKALFVPVFGAWDVHVPGFDTEDG